MKKIIYSILLSLLIWNVGFSQPDKFNRHQSMERYFSTMTDSLHGLPSDTFFVRPALRNLHWIARKGDSTYHWSITQVKWVLERGVDRFSSLTDITLSKLRPGAYTVYQGSGIWKNRNPPYKDTMIISISGITGLHTFGDSYGTASFVSSSTYWPKQLQDSLGFASLTNQNVNSAGWYKVAKTIMVDNWSTAGSPRTTVAAIFVGSGDVLSNEGIQANRNKVYGLTKVALVNLFLKSVNKLDTVTRSGFANGSVGCQSKAAVIGGNVQVASASGSTITIKWTGDNLVLFTFSSIKGTSNGSFKIIIDGSVGFGGSQNVNFDGSEKYASYGTYIPADESGLTMYPDVIVIRGLTNSFHTAVVTSNSNTATYLDAYGILEAPASCKPVVIGSIPHFDAEMDWGFSLSPSMRPRHNDYADVISASIRNGCEVFSDFPLSFVDVDNYVNAHIGTLRPDDLHYNATGMNGVAKALEDGLRFRRLDKMDHSNSKITFLPPLTWNSVRDEAGVDTSSSPTALTTRHYVDSVVTAAIGIGTADTIRVETPLKVKTGARDTIYMKQVGPSDSGWVSPTQKAGWDAKQDGDADLTAIAGLSPSNDDIIQRKSGAWTNRTLAQYKSDLALNNVDNTSDVTKNAASATLTNKVTEYSEIPANQSYTGETVKLTYGESLVPGDLVYFKSDGKVWKADANVSTTYPVMGMAVETASSGSHIVLLRGVYRDDSRYSFTVGGTVYLSTTAGGETQTQPSTTDDVIQVIGIALHADRIFFNPQLVWITHL